MNEFTSTLPVKRRKSTFVPTDEQRDIMDYLLAQIGTPDGHNVVVSGAGGTGKTTMVCHLIIEMLEMGLKVAVTAMTGKATAVLRTKIYDAIRESGVTFDTTALKIETFTKITKKSSVVSLTESGETLYTSEWLSPYEFKFDVLIVDELSMVPCWLGHWWRATSARVFGFGDECQLPEVNTPQTNAEVASFKRDLGLTSGSFTTGYGIKALRTVAQKKLHTVLRSDNEVALLCKDLRDFSMSKSATINCIKEWAAKTENIKYSRTLKDIETDPEWQILAFKNATCSSINNSLSIGKDYPELSDKIILLDNINPLRVYNGDTMLFGDFLAKIATYNERSKRRIYISAKFQGRMPDGDSPNPVERTFYQNYIRFKSEANRVAYTRVEGLPAIVSNSGYSAAQISEWLSEIKAISSESISNEEKFMKVLTGFEISDVEMARKIVAQSVPLPSLYVVNLDFGYCVTTHKSQGSEYQKVCYVLERFDKPLLYTGVSRAREQVKVIDLTN